MGGAAFAPPSTQAAPPAARRTMRLRNTPRPMRPERKDDAGRERDEKPQPTGQSARTSREREQTKRVFKVVRGWPERRPRCCVLRSPACPGRHVRPTGGSAQDEHDARCRSHRNPGMARLARRRHRGRRAGSRRLHHRRVARSRAPARHARAVFGEHALSQHHPARPRGPAPRRPRHRAPHPLLHPLERARHRAAREQGELGARRPHRELPVRGDALRRRLPALLARRHREARRRPRVHAGPLLARPVRPRLPRRAALRGAIAELPPGGGRQGDILLPPSLADARLLAAPDRLHGPRPADGDLPGALPQVPAPPRPRRHRRAQGLGLSRRRRDGRAGEPGRHRHGRAGAPRQPGLRHQLQPAAPRRAGARQRQDHPGAGGRLPRRGLERHQEHLGLGLGPADRPRHQRHPAAADGGGGRRRVPGLQVEERRLCARALLRQVSRAEGDGRRHDGRPDLGADPRRPRPAEGLCGLRRGDEAPRPAHRHPRQDRQGLRDG